MLTMYAYNSNNTQGKHFLLYKLHKTMPKCDLTQEGKWFLTIPGALPLQI